MAQLSYCDCFSWTQTIGGGNRGDRSPLKFKAFPWECNFCNRKLLEYSKVAPLLSAASSASDTDHWLKA